MKSIAFIFITVLFLLVPQLSFSQTSQSDNSGRIAALEAKVAALETYIKSMQSDKLLISSGKTKARIEIKVVDDRPVIQFFDKDDEMFLELGLSEWFGQPLVTITSNDINSYLWAGAQIVSEMQWKDLRTTAKYNCQDYLSDKLIKISLTVVSEYNFSSTKNERNIWVDVNTQPAWNYYTGTGKFSVSDREVRAAFIEAAEYIRDKIVANEYSEEDIKNYPLTIYFTIRGYSVGIWQNGSMKLTGE